MVLLKKSDDQGSLVPVIQAAILGSILTNLLLCMGLCFFVGGLIRDEQEFHPAVSEVGSGLLLVAGFALAIPSAFFTAAQRNTASSQATLTGDVTTISRATSIVLIVAFLFFLLFNARTHHGVFDEVLEIDEGKDEDRHKDLAKAKLTFTECIVALVIALACVSLHAVFLVEEIEFIVREKGVPDAFMGLILVPFVEKAAEHLTAIDEAWDNQMNFALFHCLGPSIQTALLNAPLVVIVGWIIGKPMELNFDVFFVVILILSILVVGNFLRDGKSNYLEGALCVLVWIIIAICKLVLCNSSSFSSLAEHTNVLSRHVVLSSKGKRGWGNFWRIDRRQQTMNDHLILCFA